MQRILILAAAASTAALGCISAHAGCADPRTLVSGSVHRTTPTIVLPAAAASDIHRSGDAGDRIVGTWLATYTVEGNAFGQAYIQWHSDGTEWENINLPVDGGNICAGSWMKVDSKHVFRNHWGWLYTNGQLSGYFNETETDAVAHNGTYSGTNEQKIYDLNGNLLNDVTGTSSAVLIAP
ncbi:MAG TPA: hypothetical protein VHX61_11335 [Rhizomicrobium sp.]|jgi:hypothetical protein|nr:hypothetical protein [Rhizomicrobium sp.]